ncbi:MAG: ATP-binding cassette domain-containing protein [Nitrospirae bacterium]|nr:ATP-binding cassette domain-containing protein [Nitrospirota bacterium]
MNQPILEFKDVSKAVWRNVNGTKVKAQILSNIDLVVQRGDLVTIMGPSGSGKSTFLRLVNRLSEGDSGDILLGGRNIKNYPPGELRRKVGMVFQVPVVFPGSVRDNLGFGMKLWNEDIDLDVLARDADIPDGLLDAEAGKLSVGEKQRVCIARALANRPEVLLLDEPTSSLDNESARIIEELLLGLCEEQDLTIFWVTHETEQAKRIGGRRFVLNKGRLEEEHD